MLSSTRSSRTPHEGAFVEGLIVQVEPTRLTERALAGHDRCNPSCTSSEYLRDASWEDRGEVVLGEKHDDDREGGDVAEVTDELFEGVCQCEMEDPASAQWLVLFPAGQRIGRTGTGRDGGSDICCGTRMRHDAEGLRENQGARCCIPHSLSLFGAPAMLGRENSSGERTARCAKFERAARGPRSNPLVAFWYESGREILAEVRRQRIGPISLLLLCPSATLDGSTFTKQLIASQLRELMENNVTVNTVPCGGVQNVDDGCGCVFPRQSTPGLCQLCLRLNKATSAQERAEVKNTLVQCMSCGIIGTKVTNPCKSCHIPRQGQQSQAARTTTSSERTSQTTLGSSRQGQVVTTGSNSNAGVDGHSRKDPGFCIQHECRLSTSRKVTDAAVGISVHTYSGNMTMLAAYSARGKLQMDNQPLYAVEPGHECALSTSGETQLRLPGNLAIISEDMSLTVKEWYKKYQGGPLSAAYVVLPKVLVATKQQKGKKDAEPSPGFCVELLVLVEKYNGRLNIPKGSRTRKRSGSQTASKPKRTRRDGTSSEATILTSTFDVGSIFGGSIPVRTIKAIDFRRTICTVNATTGLPELEELQTLEKGTLSTTHMYLDEEDMGRTKNIFRLTIGDSQYVAKEVKNIGEGCVVTFDLANNVLMGDLVRLKRMGYFCQRSLDIAKKMDVDVARFSVSDGFLMKTYDSNGEFYVAEASQAMGVYLVEPYRRNSSVTKYTKYSGTLGEAREDNHMHSTMPAFVHYVAEETACRYIFADVQGSLDDRDIDHVILFDPMTRTINKLSGLGDFGIEGIQHFINNHRCTPICRDLKLASMETLQNTLDSIVEGAA
ncbi:hypothetical protein C8Q80DRAFT_1124099 [Daedaleopsis nitida]|nr:hypothetical protein C8Q80DRAFT_1124099 [Daedaleopsis nitida]